MMVAVLASCEKHEIRNEVLTEIGFTSNVGKQTKAIADGNTYSTSQPFGVYAYSKQEIKNSEGTVTATNTATVMPNVEIIGTTVDNTTTWKSNPTHGSFYWPNDSRTTMNFYAYSPYLATEGGIATSATDDDQKLNGKITHGEDTGLKLEGYIHSNQYVDFMVADPVTGATYANPDGSSAEDVDGTVPVKFRHQMTQLIFEVVNTEYKDVTFTIKSITLSNIKDKADYSYKGTLIPNSNPEAYDYWTNETIDRTHNGVYTVYTGTTNNTVTSGNNATSVTTDGMTVIPQDLNEQTITIVYDIDGTGVAKETDVIATATLMTNNAPTWKVNQKITYTISIGMREIKFKPEVVTWTEETGSQTVQPVTPSN
jgi:hypothetical protein